MLREHHCSKLVGSHLYYASIMNVMYSLGVWDQPARQDRPKNGNNITKECSGSGSEGSEWLKGHGNEADFLGVLHKLVWHRSLTIRFQPFDFSLEFSEIFKKWLPVSPSRVGGSIRLLINIIFFKPGNKSMVIVYYIPGSFFANWSFKGLV